MEPADLFEVLQRQHGVVARSQVLASGAATWLIRRELESGRWKELAPGVYGLSGHRPSWRRDLWIAHLHAGPGSVVSHEAAGRLRGLAQVPAGRVVLSVPHRRRHAPAGVRWRRIDDLEPGDVSRIDGLPVTSLTRTVVDLAGSTGLARLRLVAEQAVVEGSSSTAELGAMLDRVRRRGKPGVARMARVLDDLGPGEDLPRSELERLADRVAELAGLPEPRREHPLPNERGRTGFVDRCWENAMWILEADGRRWHGRRQQMLADADRTLESQALGYETTRLLWEHAHSDPSGTAVLLRSVYDQRVTLVAALRGTRDI
jgi:predicted transcriptional regulator of viral defense system